MPVPPLFPVPILFLIGFAYEIICISQIFLKAPHLQVSVSVKGIYERKPLFTNPVRLFSEAYS